MASVNLVRLTKVFGQITVSVLVDSEVFELHVGDFKLARKDFDKAFLGHVSQVHQGTAQAFAGRLLGFKGLFQLFARNVLLGEEHLADTHLGGGLHLNAEDAGKRIFAHHAQTDQDLGKGHARALVFGDGMIQLVFVQNALAKQQFT